MQIQPKGDFSPKLKKIVKEIEAILHREDVGGLVILNDGEGHGEYRLFLEDPKWSVLRFMGNGGVHIKAHMKSKKMETAKTVNMIVNQLDICGHVFMMLDSLKKKLNKHMEIEETEKGEFYHGPG